MFDDVYTDQIMFSSSRTWTNVLIKSLREILINNEWNVLDSNNVDYLKCTKNHKIITVNLTHVTPHKIYDYIISDCVSDEENFKIYPEVFGVYAHPFEYESRQPTKMFNCFINRGCGFRQSWFYFFVRQNLLDHGHISFWCQDRFNKFSSTTDFSEYLFQTCNKEMFFDEHEQMRGKIPYKNFDISLEDAVIESERSLVIETFFADKEICYSEKTWRAIQLPRPMLVFGSQYAIKHLRQWGFDVFDEVIDHSYDNEPDPKVRQQMILQQLIKPINYDPVLFEQKAQHNRNLLRSYQQQWSNKYKNIVDIITAISNNESLTSRA